VKNVDTNPMYFEMHYSRHKIVNGCCKKCIKDMHLVRTRKQKIKFRSFLNQLLFIDSSINDLFFAPRQSKTIHKKTEDKTFD
jgi:hypothetical protein